MTRTRTKKTNTDKINEIASAHLGKAGDGTVVKPYVTPDTVDTSLLVGVPRVLNRTAYEIDESNLPFVGFDTWNSYEFSTLTNNGFPVSGLLRLVYPANSANIVESKSLKLYLNSFNMMKNGATVHEVINKVEQKIAGDLLGILGSDYVDVKLHVRKHSPVGQPILGNFVQIEEYIDPTLVSFEHFNESPDILDVFDDSGDASRQWHSAVLRSNCRVTNQPDWGDVYIAIKGDLQVTPESLLQYIVSMRKENHFHEEIAECIYKRLYDLLDPEELFVACLYTRRGGIDINPARANTEEVLNRYAMLLRDSDIINNKTLRQ